MPYLPLWIYVYQPALRFENYVFTRGTGSDPTLQPATISGQADTREGRAGLATSFGWRALRAGAALEWTRRQDRYFMEEQSGAPDQGQREVSFDGTALGGVFGLRFDSADSGSGRVTVGVGARYVPALEIQGEQVLSIRRCIFKRFVFEPRDVEFVVALFDLTDVKLAEAAVRAGGDGLPDAKRIADGKHDITDFQFVAIGHDDSRQLFV